MIVIRKYLRSFQRETLANRLRLHEQIIWTNYSSCCYQIVVCWQLLPENLRNFRTRHPEVFLRKGVLKICSKCTGEHPYRIFSEHLFLRTLLGGCFWNLLLFIFFIFRHSCNGWNEWSREILFRSSYWRCYITKAVLKNFAIFKGKHLRCILNCVELNLVF